MAKSAVDRYPSAGVGLVGEKMTCKERFLAALRHEESDRVPVAPRPFYYMTEKYGASTPENQMKIADDYGWDKYIQVPCIVDNIVSGFNKNYDYDTIPDVRVTIERWVEGTNTYFKRTFNTPAGVLSDKIMYPRPGTGYGIRPAPHHDERLIKDKDDIEKLHYLLPDPQKHARKDEVNNIAKMLGDDGLLAVTVYTPMTCKAGTAMAMEDLMVAYYDDKSIFLRLLEIFHKHVMEETRMVCETDADVVYGTWYYGSLSAGWSPKIWEELFFPQIVEHVQLVHDHGKIYHFYDDGKLMPIIEKLRDA
jgi:hypothetical protein